MDPRHKGVSLETMQSALDRAYDAKSILQQVAGDDWVFLAAVGVRESFFLNRDEEGDGAGVGIFQIDLDRNPGVTREQAGDLSSAAYYVWNNIDTVGLANTLSAFRHNSWDVVGWDTNFSSDLRYQIMARAHNAGQNSSYLRRHFLDGVDVLNRRTANQSYVGIIMGLIRCFQ